MKAFSLHPQLAADCHVLGDLSLSCALLLDDSRYPWVILVPRRPALRELFQLDARDRVQLLDESCRVGEFLLRHFGADKLNVAALGNLVPQLHLHHVARNATDPAWPGPVWGHSPALPYTSAALHARVDAIRKGLQLDLAGED